MKKFKGGDKVNVGGDTGHGKATVTGFDEKSGTYTVQFTKVTVNPDGDKIKHENVPGYVPEHLMTRRK